MSDVLQFTPKPPEDLFHQRQLTRDIIAPWGLLPAVYGHGKIPVAKITEDTGKTVDPVAWATPGTAQSKFDLLGRLSPSTIDLDLDVRMTADPHVRPSAWSEEEKALATEWFYRPFREELRRLAGDTRNHWGRASIGGCGHWLIRLLPDDDVSFDERRGRLKQLQFTAAVERFTVKLEVRFPAKATANMFAVLPGSRYADGDYVRFFNSPKGRDSSPLQELPLQGLCQAVYGAALRIVTAPITGEGERHNAALLVSGVLRREVEEMEREGGGFNRDEARRLFEEIFAHDTEIKARRRVFETDFEREDSTDLPGYPALGKRVGEEASFAIARMLHGYDRSAIDRLRDRIVFLNDETVFCVDLEERSGGNNLTLYPRTSLNLVHIDTIQMRRGKAVKAFTLLQTMKSRRQADGWVSAPGYEQGAYLYQSPDGRLTPERQSELDRALLNRAPGWVTPYVEEDLTSYPDAVATLKHMIGWFTGDPDHHRKIMQAIAFKVQNPLVKAQFALAVVGGQGIGKSTFFHDVFKALLGGSVTVTSLNELYSGQYTLSPAVGASLLIIEEADAITNFTLSKQLHRLPRLTVNLKYAAKGPQWCFGIPIYLTNKSNPRLQEEGAPDRTLYVIEAPTQESLRLTAEEWAAFQRQRTAETDAVRAKLKNPEFLLALRQIFEEYEVTLEELQNTAKSDSLKAEYREHDLSPDQLALQAMLARGYVHHAHPDWAFDAPVTKEIFNDGYNTLYRYFTSRNESIKSNQYISRQLMKLLAELGLPETYQKYKEGRVYWFRAKLGTLRKRFAEIAGTPVPDEAPAEEGPNEQSIDACSRAWEYWKKQSRLTSSTDY